MPTNITKEVGQIEHVVSLGYRDEDGEPVHRREMVWVASAQSAEGDRWISSGLFETEAEAKDWLVRHPDVNEFDAWMYDTPVYGSEAWGSDEERDLAAFEADAYGEPRPQW